MATYRKKLTHIEAIQLPAILTKDDPFDFPEKPEWINRAIDLGEIRPSLMTTSEWWVYEVGKAPAVELAETGDYIVLLDKDTLRKAGAVEFNIIYEYDVNPGRNVLESRYDEQTLRKVYDVLHQHGLLPSKMMDIINDMQNAGILFRERA